MNILIANTRHLEAPELRILAGELAKNHRVTVCSLAMGSHQRGNAFSYSGSPIKFKLLPRYTIDGQRIPAYKFNGTPADMMSIMLGEVMRHKKPNLVICGVNNGITIGTDVFCSSNIGMAMQAVFANVPCVAVGLPLRIGGYRENELLPVAQFVAKNVDKFAKMKLPTDTFLNISLPVVKKYEDYQGIGISSMDNLTKLTRYVEKEDCKGDKYYWAEVVEREADPNSPELNTAGLSYFKRNYIIMSPLTYDCTDYKQLTTLQNGGDTK